MDREMDQISLNVLTRTTEHLMIQTTAVLDGTTIIPKTVVNMMMMILRPMRCAAHVKLLVVIFQETNYQLSLKCFGYVE